jgi:hypothetical protein
VRGFPCRLRLRLLLGLPSSPKLWCVPQTLSAGGGIPRAAPLRAPDPIRRGRNTQSCTFACPGPYPPGAEYPELHLRDSLWIRFGWVTCDGCSVHQAEVAGAGPMLLLVRPSLVGVAGSARPSLLCRKASTLAAMAAVCFLGMRESVPSAVGHSHDCLLPLPCQQHCSVLVACAALCSVAFPTSTSCACVSALWQAVRRLEQQIVSLFAGVACHIRYRWPCGIVVCCPVGANPVHSRSRCD